MKKNNKKKQQKNILGNQIRYGHGRKRMKKNSKSYYIYSKSQGCDRTVLNSKEMPEARKAEVINNRGQRKGRLKIL